MAEIFDNFGEMDLFNDSDTEDWSVSDGALESFDDSMLDDGDDTVGKGGFLTYVDLLESNALSLPPFQNASFTTKNSFLWRDLETTPIEPKNDVVHKPRKQLLEQYTPAHMQPKFKPKQHLLMQGLTKKSMNPRKQLLKSASTPKNKKRVPSSLGVQPKEPKLKKRRGTASNFVTTRNLTPKKCSSPRSKGANGKSTCEYCLQGFKTKETLQAHRQQHMVGNKFYCTFPGCEKIYTTGEGLRLHTKNVHLDAKCWKCLSDGCDRSFVRQSDLRMHVIRIHSTIRPFPCPITTCSKAFACNSELRRHTSSCHKTEKQTLGQDALKPKKVAIDPAWVNSLMMKVESP